MSLEGVAVGDEVVVVGRGGVATRERVGARGRKYLTIGRRRYDRETGACVDAGHSNKRVYTVETWTRLEARGEAVKAFNAAVRKVAGCQSIEHLSVEDIQVITTELTAIGLRLSP